MTDITYTKLLNETLEIYMEKGAEEAYKFISKHADEVVGDHAQIYNFRYSLAAASGHEQEALTIMKEAILEKGHWYAYDYLKEDEDLDPLRKYAEFQQMLEVCKQREEEAKQRAKPEMEVLYPEKEQKAQSFMIALHGNQENISRTKENWSGVTRKGFLLGMPQSSQIEFSDGYSWDDLEQGTHELKSHYNQLRNQGNANEEQVIIGGFSAGARVALHTILEENLPIRGFIFVAPWLPDVDDLQDKLPLLAEQGIKGYIICGDHDQDCLEETNRFVELLKEKDIPHTYKLVEGLDHDYPDGFDEFLSEAIQYLE